MGEYDIIYEFHESLDTTPEIRETYLENEKVHVSSNE